MSIVNLVVSSLLNKEVFPKTPSYSQILLGYSLWTTGTGGREQDGKDKLLIILIGQVMPTDVYEAPLQSVMRTRVLSSLILPFQFPSAGV